MFNESALQGRKSNNEFYMIFPVTQNPNHVTKPSSVMKRFVTQNQNLNQLIRRGLARKRRNQRNAVPLTWRQMLKVLRRLVGSAARWRGILCAVSVHHIHVLLLLLLLRHRHTPIHHLTTRCTRVRHHVSRCVLLLLLLLLLLGQHRRH